MASAYRSVRIVYEGRGRDILWWCVTTAFFSLITLGLYLPVAINRLVRYIFDNTELQVQEQPASQAAEVPAKETPVAQPSDG
ncbi:MAG: DUF898 family protein [Dehalococcoidia bacterium]|nr:DUF898 family protein [Dehalococcoidia bacterium]